MHPSIHSRKHQTLSFLPGGIVTPSELPQVRRRATSSAPRGSSVTSASPSLPVALLVLSAAAGCLHSQADVSRGLCPRVLSLNQRLSPRFTLTPACQPAGSAKTSTCAPTSSLARSLARHQLSSLICLNARAADHPPPTPRRPFLLPHPLAPPPTFFLLIPSAKKKVLYYTKFTLNHIFLKKKYRVSPLETRRNCLGLRNLSEIYFDM